MLETPFFSVIIVNYNSGAYLQGAVDSLVEQTFLSFELLIVDNASADHSMTTLDLSNVDQAQVIMMGENSGFARANNAAAARARGEWLVLLNADAVASPNWLEEIKAAIVRHPSVKMFASAQLRMEEVGLIDGAGDACTAYGYPWRGGYMQPTENIPGEGECFSPCGASAVYEKAAYLQVGGFDERFFCYVEDTDIAYRLRLSGETCVFLPSAVITHKGGGLSGEESEFSVVHGSRNRVWCYFGNTPSLLFWPTLPMHILLTLYLLIFHFGRPYGGYVWKGASEGWGRAWAMRREGKARRVNRSVSLFTLAGALTWNIFKMSARRPDVRPLKKG